MCRRDSCEYRFCLLTVIPALHVSGHVPPPNINPPITDITATVPLVRLTTVNTRRDASAIVVILESTRTRTATLGNPKALGHEAHQPIHQPSDPHTEVVVTTIETTTETRTLSEAVTARTDPITTGVEKKTRTIGVTESAQCPRRLASTAPADVPYPTPTLTPTATRRNTTIHLSHRESGVPTTKTTRTATATGSAPDAITKTCPKRGKTATAHPNPANVTPESQDPTTTEPPKALLPTKQKEKPRTPLRIPKRRRNQRHRPKDRR